MSRYNARMKYNLRSLMLDAFLVLPFLVGGALAVSCVREAIAEGEMLQAYRNNVRDQPGP